jgi:hypothetical protein
LVTARIAEVRAFRLLAILLSATVLAFAAAGCGGGGSSGSSASGTEPGKWATSVCGAIHDWVNGLQAGSQKLSQDLQATRDVKAVKDRFVLFLSDAEKSAGVMIAKVRTAGAPAVKEGEGVQRDLVAALERARASFRKAVASAKELPTENQQAFSNGVGTLSVAIQRELTATGEDFDKLSQKYNDKELNKATNAEPTCKELSSSTS